MKYSIWNFLFYIFIGDTLGAAIQTGSVGLLLIAIVGAGAGLLWVFPLFLPEEKRDKKL